MMPTFRMLGGFTGEKSLVHCLHRGDGGGAVKLKLFPSVVDLICTQVGGNFLPGGGGFAGNVLKACRVFGTSHSFLHLVS